MDGVRARNGLINTETDTNPSSHLRTYREILLKGWTDALPRVALAFLKEPVLSLTQLQEFIVLTADIAPIYIS